MSVKKKKTDYVKKAAENSSKSYEELEREMSTLKCAMGISYKEFYKHELWKKSTTQQNIRARYILRNREKRESAMAKVREALGITANEVIQLVKEINHKGIYKFTIITFALYEVYRYQDEELDNVLHLFARRKALRDSLRQKLLLIDAGELSYEILQEELQELYALTNQIMPDSLKEELAERIIISRPELLSDKEKLNCVVVDMNATRFLLEFTYSEYVSFQFSEKSLEEKHAFISDMERMRVIKSINDECSFDMLDNKFQTYTHLKRYYHRKMEQILSEKDYFKFRRFCFGKKVVVVKPFFDSMGRGIKPVYLKSGKKLKTIFKELCKTYHQFILEELIVAHNDIKALNADSVNTVRVITYFDGKNSIIHSTFAKVGKAGSFVDNGGAGGILISVDPETGMLNSPGCDENGLIYETHPDTGIRFYGYQLPDWDQLRKVTIELSTKIPGIKYIGWDMTYTKKKRWVVVEGNAKTQFFGQQCTTGIGARIDFYETVGYSKEI